MQGSSITLTVFFDEPFWVGVFERMEGERLSVCRVTFGAEPKDYELWEFILRHYYELKFSPAVQAERRKMADNPKRRQRNAKKQLQKVGVGTKSQQAILAAREQMKTERKTIRREQKKAESDRQFALRQEKRKEKHRGH